MYRQGVYISYFNFRPLIIDANEVTNDLYSYSEVPRAFGDYQYFLSYGGDRFFNMPLVIETETGLFGHIIQIVDTIVIIPFQLVGYSAYGKFRRF